MASESSLIFDLVERWVAERPDLEALRNGEQSWTWAELAGRVRRAAGALRAAGVQPGDRLACLDKNHPATLELTLAASLIGAVNVIVNFRLSPDELGYLLADSQARLIVAGTEFTEVVDRLRDRLPGLEQVIVLGEQYEAWLANAQPIAEKYPAGPGDCFLQLYTSGTTGRPKGAMLTQRGLTAHTVTAVHAYGMDRNTVNVVAMPLFHVGGTCWALGSMFAGGQTLIVRELNPSAVLELIERRQATHAFFVPAVISMLLADPARAALDRLQVLGYGGSPMPGPLMRRTVDTLSTPLYSEYGMTELSGVFCALGPDEHRDPTRPGLLASAGRPLPGNQVRVVDPMTGQDVEAGELGEFWVRSAQVMAGYWRQPEASAQTLVEGGWLRTGDAGRRDAEGYLFIEDRVKDMIITGGENVYPAEVERVLAEHPAVLEVAVLGRPDDKWGETVVAVIVPAAGSEPDPGELIGYARDRLAHYKCPVAIQIVEALPRNPTGKILKRELRDQLITG